MPRLLSLTVSSTSSETTPRETSVVVRSSYTIVPRPGRQRWAASSVRYCAATAVDTG